MSECKNNGNKEGKIDNENDMINNTVESGQKEQNQDKIDGNNESGSYHFIEQNNENINSGANINPASSSLIPESFQIPLQNPSNEFQIPPNFPQNLQLDQNQIPMNFSLQNQQVNVSAVQQNPETKNIHNYESSKVLYGISFQNSQDLLSLNCSMKGMK